MTPFLDENMLLDSPTARRLYRDHAETAPIYDYHNHLAPAEVADDRAFTDLAQVWLADDHYKWRLMRANGVPEDLITGRPAGKAAFLAWAATLPRALGNPLHLWSHLELRRVFGITDVLNPASAQRIWDQANERLRSPEFTVHGLLTRFRVEALCTTDSPADDLAAHRRHAEAPRGSWRGLLAPTFRPDRLLDPSQPGWGTEAGRLANADGQPITGIGGLLAALQRRHTVFHTLGCRFSDHGLARPPGQPLDPEALDRVVRTALAGTPADPDEAERFAAALLLEVGRWNREAGWTLQLHLGPQRNLSSRGWAAGGADRGHDAASDEPLARRTAAFLDLLDRNGALPRVVLYPLNPAAQTALATVAGSFNDGSVAGQVQLGAAWWFNDTIDGMTRQLTDAAEQGLLAHSLGMLTDSRSFLSFSRHEVFRRTLCRLVGRWVEAGLIPDDEALTGGLVADLCHRNARRALGLSEPAAMPPS